MTTPRARCTVWLPRSAAHNRYRYFEPEGDGNRFEWGDEGYEFLDDFNNTLVEEWGRYMSGERKNRLLQRVR